MRKTLKELELSIPTLDVLTCKQLMGGDGYIEGGDACGDVIILGEIPDDRDFELDPDLRDEDCDISDNDNADNQDTNQSTDVPLTEDQMSKLLSGLHGDVVKMLKAAFNNGKVVMGWGENPKASAYYNPATGQIVVNNVEGGAQLLEHELTHLAQDQNDMLSGPDSDIGDANNEFQASFMQALFDIGDGEFGERGWINGEHDEEWILNHISYDEDSDHLSVDNEFWNWLNDNDSMNDAMEDWLDYWRDRDGTPDTYIDGAQDNWNYNWEEIFDSLGIGHP